jgi:hypothetical protein
MFEIAKSNVGCFECKQLIEFSQTLFHGRHDVLHNDTKYNGIQYKDTQHKDIQYNDTRHNDIQRSKTKMLH